jgi:transposase
VRDLDAGTAHIYLEFEYRRVNCPRYGTVKRETLSWLASSARFTQRFEDRIGLLCREMSVKRVAELNDLSWDQVCRMEKSYMRRLMEQHPPSAQLRVIGIDEISIRKGHTYAIVVADLDQKRPIWLGGQGRTEKDMDLFFDVIGEKRCTSIRLAVMDMWKPFRSKFGVKSLILTFDIRNKPQNRASSVSPDLRAWLGGRRANRKSFAVPGIFIVDKSLIK